MGAGSSSEEKLERATPHLSLMDQEIVPRLMEDYPKIDQLMAETIVWKYNEELKAEEAKKGDAENAGVARDAAE